MKNPNLYSEIHDEDLIAKEFKYHTCCYTSFTRNFSKVFRDEFDQPGPSSAKKDNQQSDFPAVCKFIKKEVLSRNHPISMQVLQNIYNGSTDARYRRKLKQRIITEFPGKLHFVRPLDKKPDILISVNPIRTGEGGGGFRHACFFF